MDNPLGTELNRRQLMAVAGSAGLASFVAACSAQPTPPLATQQSATKLASTSIPVAPSPPTPAVSGVMLCRQAWGARPARPGGRPHTISRMTLHHSAVALPDNRGIVARLQQHQRFHQDTKGWVDIAYHAAVDRNGNIFQLRDTAIAGDTATTYDTTGHFLVLAEGNFDQEAVSEAQLNGVALVFAWATSQFRITVDTLATHREVAAGTDCPGQNLQAHVDSGDLANRIVGVIAQGFELQPICGPAADQRIAAIEAGT